jgi:threonine synthase
VSYYTHLECTACGRTHPTDRWIGVCTCGRSLFARYDLAAIRRDVPRDAIARRAPTMWRYRELLPFDADEPVVTMAEGFTPLVPLERVGPAGGLPRLFVKDEGRNPTGVFKARGAAVGVSKARALGIRRLIVPTVGSGGSAWAAYGARAGLEIIVTMPVADAPMIARKDCVIAGARVILIDGTTTDLFQMSLRAAERYGWTPIIALREPFRVEGKKTMGYELAEQFGWQVPDVVLYPTGGGVGLIGMSKAFDELEALGWIGPKRPRLVSVQAAGCAPVVRAIERGADACEPWERMDTVVPGVKVAKAFADRLILQAVRASGGTAVAVDDAETLAMQRRLAVEEGLYVSPEGAMTVAAALRLRNGGAIRPDETVVVFNTATGMRYPHLVQDDLPVVRAGEEITVDGSPTARAHAPLGRGT